MAEEKKKLLLYEYLLQVKFNSKLNMEEKNDK
jgi:hypothetical protein